MNANDRPLWARALTDPAAFAHEQAKLGQYWTLLGLATDIPDDGDWFRATLGGRSVFVQRFGDTLRGFENRCAHRFYPLRLADKGNGVIRCGFHHWQYDKDGRALGIPKCQEMFGKTPRDLDARLTRIEIATCGMLVFGRFPPATAGETLQQYLGDGYAILQAMCTSRAAPLFLTRPVAANWKLCFHITLDDYHIVAVHPTTVGRSGYMPADKVRYFRFGRHSAFFETDTVETMAAQCREGTYRPSEYRIMQFFPNLVAVHFCASRTWYVVLQQYLPLACDRSLLRAWAFPAPFPAQDCDWRDRLIRQAMAPLLPLGMRFQWPKVLNEDHAVCERLQTVAAQADGLPILGKQEERIAWFEEAYADAMAAPGALALCL
jgi:phenylpropionate dioxygenase-like ring-hydroxylating dioxygenase large terminal subunit